MKNKLLAIIEVFIIVFAVIPLTTLLVYKLFPQFETFQTHNLGFPFPIFGHVIMIGITVLLIVIRKKKLSEYGLTLKNIRYQLDIFATCFIPFVLANLPFGMGVDHKSLQGSIILTCVQIGLLFVSAFLLKDKNLTAKTKLLCLGLVLLPGLNLASANVATKVLISFSTYAIFVGFGEEIIYRGYVQSRLNEVFDKPYKFFKVQFGWGLIIASIIFGLTHVGILSWFLGLSNEITLAWGLWTVFSGLVLGFVREKSNSILPSALLHGLPQAIATVIVLLI